MNPPASHTTGTVVVSLMDGLTGSVPSPLPVDHLRHVNPVVADVHLGCRQLFVHRQDVLSRSRCQSGNALDHVPHQTESVDLVEHTHVEWCGRCPSLFAPSGVQVLVVRPNACVRCRFKSPMIQSLSSRVLSTSSRKTTGSGCVIPTLSCEVFIRHLPLRPQPFPHDHRTGNEEQIAICRRSRPRRAS